MTRYCIGIGAQKCASSWLHAVLGSHPDIAASNPKEVDFFSDRFDHGYGWYEGHFGDARGWRLDVSPSYFHHPAASDRLAQFAPDARIIVLLRDPVERAYSNHLHEVLKGHIAAIPFAAGLANNPAYVEQGRYHTHLARWFASFPSQQILCLLTEDIAADPEGAARQVFAFLGLDGDHQTGIVAERRNQSARARVPILRTILRVGGDYMRALGHEEHLMRLKKTRVIARLLQLNSVDLRQDVPPMSDAERADLIGQFAPEVARLGILLGRNFSRWENFAQPSRRSDQILRPWNIPHK